MINSFYFFLCYNNITPRKCLLTYSNREISALYGARTRVIVYRSFRCEMPLSFKKIFSRKLFSPKVMGGTTSHHEPLDRVANHAGSSFRRSASCRHTKAKVHFAISHDYLECDSCLYNLF